jgi:hypothetical protein
MRVFADLSQQSFSFRNPFGCEIRTEPCIAKGRTQQLDPGIRLPKPTGEEFRCDSGAVTSSGDHFALGCCHAEAYIRDAPPKVGAKIEHCFGFAGHDPVVQEKSCKVNLPGMCCIGFVPGCAGDFVHCQSKQPWP